MSLKHVVQQWFYPQVIKIKEGMEEMIARPIGVLTARLFPPRLKAVQTKRLDSNIHTGFALNA